MKTLSAHSMELPLGKKVRIHLLLPLLFLSAYLGGYLLFFAVSWGLALLHELAHLLVGRSLGISFSGVTFLPFGVCAKLKDPIIKSPAKEILTALAGPLSSMVLSLLFGVLSKVYPTELLSYTSLSAFALGALNLLPCLPLDGGRILRALLTLSSDAISAWQTTARISRWIALCLLGLALYFFLTSSFQFSLLLIGIFLMGNLITEERSISHQALRELLCYKEKPERDSFTRTDLLTAYQDFPARKILRKLSYHKYYTIQVLDQNQVPIKTLTESQVLDAILTKGIRITLGEI